MGESSEREMGSVQWLMDTSAASGRSATIIASGFAVSMLQVTQKGWAPSAAVARLIDAAGEPTRAARDEILAFFAQRLLG